MAAEKQAEQQKVQRFLQRAEPIVLQRRVLDTEDWGQLVALAEELGLTDEQLHGTIDELESRGVIERVELRPAKPPPLPKEEPPVPAPPPVPPPPPAAAERPELPEKPPPPARHPEPELSEEEKKNRFIQQARMIIAEQRGMSPRAQALCAATADELGLDDRQAREALKLVVDETGEAGSDGSEETQRRARWRVEGEPVPEPAPPKKKPSETFRQFVAKSLDKFADGVVSQDLEEGLIKHGTKVLRLSEVFARHLVLDVAQQKQLPVKSQQAEQARARGQQEQDPRLRRFVERAAPILAQHRGLNAKSRVLLSALAKEAGISQQEMEEAINLLQRRAREEAGDDAIQQERLELFRIYLRNSMRRLPRGMITPSILAGFAESGEHLHGVAPQRVEPTIREVANELNISVISQRQAEQHIENLVQQQLSDRVVLNGEQRERIYLEGDQWGLSAAQVDEVIREKTRSNYQRRRAERTFTNLALLAASVAVLLVIAFVGWAMFGGEIMPRDVSDKSRNDATGSREEGAVVNSTGGAASEPERGDSWWDSDLAVAVANAQIEFAPLRPILGDIASTDASRRAAAYDKLVEHSIERARSDLDRSIFLELLSRCYALDPDEDAAKRITQALLDVVVGPADPLPDDPQSYSDMFWAIRVAAVALSEEALPDQRAARLAASLGRVLGTSVDYRQDRAALVRACLGALTERLFHFLVESVERRPEAATQRREAIVQRGGRYLDRVKLDKLNADFVAAVVTTPASTQESEEDAGWQEHRALLVETVESTDPLVVARMVELYEGTSDEQLQRFLEALLLRRADLPAGSRTVAEVAEEVRESLGLSDRPRSDDDRWLEFAEAAREALSADRAAATETDEIFREILGLARLSTLGCALAQQEAGEAAFGAVLREEPLKLSASEEGGRSGTEGRLMLEPGTRNLAARSIEALSSRRAHKASAAPRIRILATMAERVSDIPPHFAAELAAYLLHEKSAQEHDYVMKHIKGLALWKNLRLAIADRLDDATLQPARVEQLVAAIVGEERLSGEDGRQDLEQLRTVLLQDVFQDLAGATVAANGKLYDRARDQLLEFYRTQAEVLGLSAGQYQDAERPSQMIRSLIQAYAERFDTGSLADEQRALVAELPHRLAAIDYMAVNDLQHTVLLDRLWLRLLTAQAAQRDTESAQEARDVVDRLNRSDQDATHLLAQLRDGQAALLRIWLLINQPN